MPGSLLHSFRQGNRSEYLAQYFLSALGVSAPVPRQEDIGIDFFCSVARKNEGLLTFDSPYCVQLGSVGGKTFSYGGVDAHGKWKEAELNWLYTVNTPLFFGLIDRKEGRFKLYMPSQFWLCRNNFGPMGQIIFCPDSTHNPLEESSPQGEILPDGCGDRRVYHVPLQKPVVDLILADLEDEELLESARGALRMAILVEQDNVKYSGMGVHFAIWIPTIISNVAASNIGLGQAYFWNSGHGKNTGFQLEKMFPFLVTLAMNFKAQGRLEELMKLKSVFSFYDSNNIPSELRKRVPELFGRS